MSGTISAALCGLTAHAFRRGIGIPLVSLESSARVSTPLARIAAQHLSALVNDSALGLHAAEESPVGAFGLMEDLIQNSRTWGEGLQRFSRYFSLIDESASIHIVYEGSKLRVICEARDMVPVAEDLLFASLVLRARQYSGMQIRPLYMRSAFPQPHELREHERMLDAPIYFNGHCTELAFEREACEVRHPSAQPAVATLLESLLRGHSAADSLAEGPVVALPMTPILSEATLAVRLCLEQGSTQLRDVANVMGTSPRSLQRYLKQAGTSVRQLVERQRADFLATQADRLSKAGAASYLGYSDRRSLRRAQTNWATSRDSR